MTDDRPTVYYMPMLIADTVTLEGMGISRTDVKLDWNKGQVGCVLVFNSYQAAADYAESRGRECRIVAVQSDFDRPETSPEPEKRMIRIRRG